MDPLTKAINDLLLVKNASGVSAAQIAEVVRPFTDKNAVNMLRDALSKSRPLIMLLADTRGPWVRRGLKMIEVIDHALIHTDPDPEVKAILNRKIA